jgi:hypothetical protein
MSTNPAEIQGSSVSRGWLHQRRVRIALVTAAVEGLLVVVGVLSWWLVVVLAIIAVGFWAMAGRSYRSGTAREVSWIFASSQALVVCVPILFKFVAKVVAIGVEVAVVVLAVVAIVYLFRERK